MITLAYTWPDVAMAAVVGIATLGGIALGVWIVSRR